MRNKKEHTKEMKELRNLVFEGEIEAIDIWFEKNLYNHSKSKQSKIIEDLSKYIINQESYFFSFKDDYFDIDKISKEKEKRINSVIKHIDLKHQLKILNNHLYDDIKIEYLNRLKQTPINKEKDIEIVNELGLITTRLFFNEKFDYIDFLINHLSYSPLDNYSQNFILMKKEKYSLSGTYFYCEDNCVKPYYDIIYNYSEEKKEYLISKNITLPSKEDVLLFISELEKNINKSKVNYSNDDRLEKIKDINNYLTYLHYFYLNDNIVFSKKQNIRHKI